MLQNIHDKAKGWIAYIILLFIGIPFAFFGIDQYFRGGGKHVAAVVNGEEVPVQLVQNTLLQLKQQFKGRLPAGMDDSVLKQSALESAINQTLLRQKLKEGGYLASDQEVFDAIAAIDVFQKDGKFDPQQYDSFLKMQRRDKTGFESEIRGDLTQQQLRNAVSGTAFLPKSQLEQYQKLRDQQREAELFTLKAANFESQVQVSDEQVAKYYENNKARFMTEEKVKLGYLDLNRETLAAAVKVDDGALKDWFEDNADRYVQPEERLTSHILVSVDDPAKDAAAKKKIDDLYAAIKSGARTFEDVASKDSDDKTAAEKNGFLGTVVANSWGPAFEKAVFALKAGEVSAPVKTEAGYEILRVSEIKPAVQKTFEQARADAEADYRKEIADKEYMDKAEKIQTLAYENEGDLAPAAKAAGLTVEQTDWLTRKQGQGVATNPKVREAAFSEDVLKSGKNSDLLELEDGHAVVVRLIDHTPPAQKPLVEVKDEIHKTLLTEEARKLTTKKGEELLKQLSAAQSWLPLAASGLGTDADIQKPGLVGRTDKQLSPEILDKLFKLQQPATGQLTWSSVASPGGDYTILALKSVKEGDAKLDPDAEAVYGNSVGVRELTAMLEGLRESAKIVTHPENL